MHKIPFSNQVVFCIAPRMSKDFITHKWKQVEYSKQAQICCSWKYRIDCLPKANTNEKKNEEIDKIN